jgi:folate-binding protein YgfZ
MENQPLLPTDAPATQGPRSLANLYPLEDLAVFLATGTDTVSFIQGQVTNDIAGAGQDATRLAGYCTAQGRLLATMVLGHAQTQQSDPPALYGMLKRDILAPVIKRLGMFVMRAKVKITAADWSIHGVDVIGTQRSELELTLGHSLPDIAWQTEHHDTGIWIAAPSTGESRWWWLTTPEQQAAHTDLLELFSMRSAQAWHIQDIQVGLPWIQAATQDLFIPQTLNLDLIQGVSFTKGCYPGQEIVARSHYRGTVKRRMALGTLELSESDGPAPTLMIDAANLPGTDVQDQAQDNQACGRIVNAATLDQSTYVLFEATFEAVEHAALCCAAVPGVSIRPLALPYSTHAPGS